LDFDAFISYASPDKPVADAVCARLEAAGIRCWIAPRDIMPGSDYGSSIIDAIHHARVLILVFSGHANLSAHVPKEVERAMSNGVPIIPFRIENVMPVKSLDYFIGSVHWLDAMTPPLENHIDSLASTVRKLCPPLTDEERRRRQGPILGNNTAAGISRDTPPAQQQVPPVPLFVPPVVPPTPSVTPPVATGMSGWSAGKIAAIAVAILVAIAIGYFLARPKTEGDTARDNPDATNPRPAKPSGGDPAPAPSTPAPSSERPAKFVDPVVGCYNWFNNSIVVARANGTASGGPFPGRWVRNPNGAYQFTWPTTIITVTTIGNGDLSLSASNQFGYSFTGQRAGVGIGLAGKWNLSNGGNMDVGMDGAFTAGPFSGTWRGTDDTGKHYEMKWPAPVDTVVLLDNGTRLAGANNYGVAVGGVRTTCP
jgi:hypothetical protein